MNKEDIITELESNEEFQESSERIDKELENLETARKELQDELYKRETEPQAAEPEAEETPELQRKENFGTRRDLGKPATWVKILLYAIIILIVIVVGSMLIKRTLPEAPAIEVPINPVEAAEISEAAAGEDLGKGVGHMLAEIQDDSETQLQFVPGELGSLVKSKKDSGESEDGSRASWKSRSGIAAASQEVAQDAEH